MATSENIAAVYAELIKVYPLFPGLKEGAAILGIPSENAVRCRFRRGTLDVRLREHGGRKCFSLWDIAEFQVTGQKQEQILSVRPNAPSKAAKNKGGRPIKAEQIAKRQARRV